MHLSVGTITVFINGLPTEVPSGLIDMRALFREDAVLVNTSGELLPINEYGILMQSLQMGESYFLVSLIATYSQLQICTQLPHFKKKKKNCNRARLTSLLFRFVCLFK